MPGIFPPTPDLSRRVMVGELMDDPGIDPGEHRRALAALARLNRVAAGARILWPALRSLAANAGHPTLRVLDLATGSADIPIRLCRLGARAGVHLQIDGCDTSATAVAVARERIARAGVSMNVTRVDVLGPELPRDYDVLMCSLFFHHLSDEQAGELLYRMRCAARRMVLVSDLVRSRMGYFLAAGASRVFSRSRVVRVDAERSVRAAFTPGELAARASEAGLEGATIARHWPERMLLEWRRE